MVISISNSIGCTTGSEFWGQALTRPFWTVASLHIIPCKDR